MLAYFPLHWRALALTMCLFACARQMPPPGGPPDEIPPRVVATVPADDSVRVGLDTSIRIRFSEAMDRPSVERAVFVSPQGSEEPEFRWRGRELEIRLSDGLQADRTYLVTVGQESADEWRNRMHASFSFGFATGEHLNRGAIHGRVLAADDQKGQIFVFGYDLALASAPDPGRDRPAYVTQPDEAGQFVLPRLGPGTYRIFAYGDQNADRTYSPGDFLALPPGDVVLEDEACVRLGDLKLAVRDTSAPALLAIRTPDRQHVLMRFDEPVRIFAARMPQLAILDTYRDTDASGIGLITAPQTRGKEYDVQVDLADPWGNRDTIHATAKGDATPDRRAPEVLAITPSRNAAHVSPSAQIRIAFSDAMRLDAASQVWVASDSTVVPEGRFDWAAPNQLAFGPARPWASGQTVRLIGSPDGFSDLAGNALADPIVFVFTVMDTAALGRISGTASSPDVVIWVQSLTHDFFAQHALRDTAFEVDDLIPGTYRISGFLDRDRDRRWMVGQIHPFVPAEPLITHADTAEVRPRWETEVRKLKPEIQWHEGRP